MKKREGIQHILDRLVAVGACWEWQGPRQKAYGHGAVWNQGTTRPAYRVVYEHLVGPVPDGLELDHTCRNPPCCNPAHLEPVTHAENMRRGSQSFDSRTHCQRGHELTASTVGWNAANQRRFCRKCKTLRRRGYRAQQAQNT